MLLFEENSEEFHWFSHTYSHSQAHLTNNMTIIENELIFNQQFAEVDLMALVNENF